MRYDRCALLVASLFASFVLVPPGGAADAGVPEGLRPPLDGVLSAARESDLVPISVVLKDQADGAELRRARLGTAPQAARRAVVDRLKAQAARSQSRILERLRELETRGLVARIRPLWIGNVIGVDAVPAVVRELAARPEVAWVNHNPKIDASLAPPFTPAPARDLAPLAPSRPFEPNEIECGVQQMRAPEVWSTLGVTGSGAVVAVIDTGVCHTHTDIASQIWVNPGEDLDHDGAVMDSGDLNGVDDDANGFIDDLIGWDFDFNDNVPDDTNSHGSHCAGTVAGDGTAGTQAGMAPDAKIMAVKVGVSFADEVDVWNAMQYAADNGANAISMSLGWPHGQNPDRATWRQNCENTIEAGTAMVIAAGNEGSGAEPDNVRTPGDVPRVITVGATDCVDNIAGFSSRGPVTWQGVPPYNDHPYPPGLIKPDVSAPGDNTKSHDVCAGYSFKSGTSMATPHVAGAVALMVSASPGLLHDDLKQILIDTAVDRGEPGMDNAYGAGRVDAYEAVLNTSTPDGKVNVKESAVSCAGTLNVTVTDADLKGAGTVSVQAFSTTEVAPESVLLTETSATSGVFKGTVQTGGGAPVADGIVQVSGGDVVTVRYIDASDGAGGVNVPKTDTAIADCTGPVIFAVGEQSVTDVQAQIVWSTNEPSDSVVHWGPVAPPANTTSAPALVNSHAVTLTGLQACTVYRYSVESRDAQGNVVLEDNGGAYHVFETQGDFGNGLQPCHAGDLTLERLTLSCSDVLDVQVIDLDLNLSPGASDSVAVTVSSTTESTPETIVLVETGANTSIFQGSIPVTSGSPSHGDGVLQVSGGDLLTATYADANDGTGAPAIAFETAVADCAGPDLSGVQVTDIGDAAATVRWTTSEPATSKVEWGSTAALGNVLTDLTLKTSHALTIQPFPECGRVHFRVTSVDAYGNSRVYDASGSPFQFNANLIPGIWEEEFEASSGWTLEGEWQIAAPQGKGTSPGDPTVAFAGTQVLGQDLTGLGAKPGDNELQSNQRAASPVINAGALTGGQIKFRRWLNVGGGGIAFLEVKKNGVWNTVWNSNSITGLTESAWSYETVNVSAYADGNAQLQIGFRVFSGPGSSANRASWNVDRLIVRSASQPEFVACGGCAGAPTFAGLDTAGDLGGCADTGIRLTWSAAPAWGTGAAGSYSVYRDTNPTFTPSASNRIATGITGTTYTDAAAPNGVTLYYLVRAENAETCSTGPANGGVTDANLVRRSAVDQIAQPDPGSIGDSLRAVPVNEAHLRLTWTASPTAARYHVYRANAPGGSWTQIADVTGTQYEDRDDLGNLNPRYYRVEAADACGGE